MRNSNEVREIEALIVVFQFADNFRPIAQFPSGHAPAVRIRNPDPSGIPALPCPGSSGVEQWIENPRVGGSIPPPGTILIERKQILAGFLRCGENLVLGRKTLAQC